LELAEDAEIDALIIADVGVFTMAGRHAPKLQRHISTQAGILNTESARAWHDMGASRVILAREMSLSEIAVLCAKRKLLSTGQCASAFPAGAFCLITCTAEKPTAATAPSPAALNTHWRRNVSRRHNSR
jgi:putative protease